jgi:hypothetical protein
MVTQCLKCKAENLDEVKDWKDCVAQLLTVKDIDITETFGVTDDRLTS